MEHYFDVRVLPDPEFNATVLLNAVYAKIHRVLLGVGQGRIGVSFPNYGRTLGDTLRMHGSEKDLQSLLAQSWLKGLRDYTKVSGVSEVPVDRKYRQVSRIQAKSANNRRKRSIAKGWLSESEAIDQIPDNKDRKLDLPYAQVRSLSSGSTMRIYVRHGEALCEPVSGQFSSYGLSKAATVPWFSG